MTRKALKGLLIAVTLGLAVALVLRARRGAPGEPAAVPADPPAGPPADVPVHTSAAAPAPAARAPRPVAAVVPAPAPAPVPARVARPAVAERPAVPPAADIVEIDPDQLPSVAEARPEPVRATRARRPQLVVGGVALAFVVVASAVGAMAYDSVKSDGDDTGPAAATGSSSPSGLPSGGPSTSLGPMQPLKFESLGVRSGGSLNQVTLPGRRSGVTADVWVWLPPQYQRDDFRNKRFPVLVVHSAYPGTGENSMLADKTTLLAKLAQGITAGTLPPFVLVAPELTPYPESEVRALPKPETLDTECSDIPGRAKMATFHNEDVREAVAATYRVAAERSAWGVLGEGAGGLCAVKYALQFPQYYAAAASIGGATALKSPLWVGSADVREAQQPAKLVGARPDVRLFLSNAANDNAGKQASAALKTAAKAPTVVETATASGDTAKQLPAALVFLGRNVTDAPPGGPPASSTRPATATATATRNTGA
ncbi:alpha/beta hydrolase [Yinghuangia soli]|uniref:Esterase n=1 Tax=Yinghuangia soli TaxID=2908204 RepID=A0AA41U4P9_9ACTN|nr:alpha/beta hydrolase-fold protein [Yinghuangia soli]MCF2529244.1 hypothetical protein [Yinghuangia soli]